VDLQAHISAGLWNAIKSPYEAGNFSHAVLEAVHFLTDVLREKSGLDGDGASLVGQALGGDSPKLRINSFQTETEKNAQRGIEQVLRGIYLAIRNPRSHEQYRDTQADADAIIHFLDYILRVLDASTEAFTVEQFLAGINDSEFVESERYGELLVGEVPTNRRTEALIAIFKIRETVGIPKLRYVISTLLSLLSESQTAEYIALVSEEFRTTGEIVAIRTAVKMLTPELWPKISEASRLRIETKFIKDMEQGKIAKNGKLTGAFATWAGGFMGRFALRSDCAGVLLDKLDSFDDEERHYVAKFFFARLPEILVEEAEVKGAIRSIAYYIQNEDENIRDATISHARSFPSEWQTQLAEALKEHTDPTNPGVVLNDGTPLLQARPEISDDDIPF
jgi:uncharacterized protein (TIGR02391 family)